MEELKILPKEKRQRKKGTTWAFVPGEGENEIGRHLPQPAARGSE